MRRALVQSTETARHPFRVRFLHTSPFDEADRAEEQAVVAPASRVREDVTFFMLSYVSGLIIFFTMIV